MPPPRSAPEVHGGPTANPATRGRSNGRGGLSITVKRLVPARSRRPKRSGGKSMPAFHKVLLSTTRLPGIITPARTPATALLPRRCFAKRVGSRTGTDARQREGGRQAKPLWIAASTRSSACGGDGTVFDVAARHGATVRASALGVLPLERQTCWPPISRFPRHQSRRAGHACYAAGGASAAGQLRWNRTPDQQQSARLFFGCRRRWGSTPSEFTPQPRAQADTAVSPPTTWPGLIFVDEHAHRHFQPALRRSRFPSERSGGERVKCGCASRQQRVSPAT